ncbi:MAG: ribokinase [Tetrasphaera sp.]|nr:ribokinase [Actinomycetota bacterium]MCB1301902.1 ribokinase [Tetrasphaera sp.]HRW01782.1 ribokinase [Tetrasphaera sp.]
MESSRGRVVVIGSLNVDQVVRVADHPKPGETITGEFSGLFAGGKGANQAVAAAEAGADVVMVGCVGADDQGRAYVARLAGLGLDVGQIEVSHRQPTGTAFITVDDAGENTVIVVAGANTDVGAGWPGSFPELTEADVVVLQLEIPLGAVAKAAELAREAGARVVLNIAPYAELPPDVLALADPIVANEHEAMALADSGAGVGSLLMTLGANGAVWDGVGSPAEAVAPDLIVDTTGAGDAFVGALAAALADGASREEALQQAQIAGAEAVTHWGAQRDGELVLAGRDAEPARGAERAAYGPPDRADSADPPPDV